MTGASPGRRSRSGAGSRSRCLWENRLSGTLPVVVTVAPDYAADGVPAQCLPGRSGGTPDAAAAALPGFSVVHLHGGMTQADSDGWAENLVAPGQHDPRPVQNEQRAAMLWYHDHVMGVTRFSVYAGLAGLWIVRDERERELGLPEGPPYELPLLLVDRNFDTAPSGGLTGDLLHKTDPEVMESFGPFTVVNGEIWPQLEVEPATYRFRLLNGSNARTYRVVLTRDGEPDHERITQIGTDGGLLLAPTAIPGQGSSWHRPSAPISSSTSPTCAPGTELTLWNTAPAPFDGSFGDPAAAGSRRSRGPAALPGGPAHPGRREARRSADRLPTVLATDFERIRPRRSHRQCRPRRSRSSSRNPTSMASRRC